MSEELTEAVVQILFSSCVAGLVIYVLWMHLSTFRLTKRLRKTQLELELLHAESALEDLVLAENNVMADKSFFDYTEEQKKAFSDEVKPKKDELRSRIRDLRSEIDDLRV